MSDCAGIRTGVVPGAAVRESGESSPNRGRPAEFLTGKPVRVCRVIANDPQGNDLQEVGRHES